MKQTFKKTIKFKFVLLFLVGATVLSSCQKENIDKTITVVPEETTSAKLTGEWEAYKVEKQELQLDSFGGSPLRAFHSMVWADRTSSRADKTTMNFKDDNTFENFYEGVLFSEGTWKAVNDSTFTMTFNPNEEWSDITTDYIVTKHCDNTISVGHLVAPPAGNHDYQNAEWNIINYFRTPGTTECSDFIDYKIK